MHELMAVQRELDAARERCWESMRQARIGNDPMTRMAAKYRKEAYNDALDMVDRAIKRRLDSLEAAA
jgi:hypothetical protein